MVGGYEMNGSGVNDLVFLTYLGGSSSDGGNWLDVDASSIYIAGETFSSNFPTTAGAHDSTLAGSVDWIAAKLSNDGSMLEYSTYIGGTGAFAWIPV
jgi:hypothetical protein